MTNHRDLTAAKVFALVGFLVLVASSYYLRSEVLALSHIRFSADELRAANDLRRLRESYPDRVERHKADMKYYDLQVEHYRKMLDLYNTDYDEYVKRIKDEYKLPSAPNQPYKPDPPELSEKFSQINADFRTRKNDYFRTTRWLNWIACAAALSLVGGLLYLLLFDISTARWQYLVALTISFVFLIGPSFHSIISGIVGFLQEPRLF
jgi:hypothetical protein